jgi:anti-sigma factor RsiW
MNCSDYVSWIERKIDGSLSPDQLEELERHLSVCPGCRAELLLQQKIGESLKSEMPRDLAPDFTERISHLVLVRAEQEKRIQRVRTLIPVCALALATVAIFLLRADIARLLPGAVQASTDAIASPLAWAGQRFINVLAKLPTVDAGDMAGLDLVMRMMSNIIVITAIPCIAVLLALRKVRAFLKE